MAALSTAAIGASATPVTANAEYATLPLSDEEAEEAGLVITSSAYNVNETISRLRQAIRDVEGAEEIHYVDHTEFAAGVDEPLREVRVFLVGMPKVESELGETAPTVGLDVPPVILVYDHEDNGVEMVHNTPEYVAARHGLTEGMDAIQTMDDRLTEIVETVNE